MTASRNLLPSIFLLALSMSVSSAAHKPEIVEGNASSPVHVIIYEDLQCSDCANFRRMLDEKLLPRYGSRVAFIHRDYPLAKHAWARPAAIAGRWVYEHNHDLGMLFRQQISYEQGNITAENLKAWLLEFASRNRLDEKGILDSLTDARLNNDLEQDLQAGLARGISKVPTVMVNGTSFVEIVVFEDVARAIDAALAR